MYDKLPIRAISLGLAALLLWWLWPSQGNPGKSNPAALKSDGVVEYGQPVGQQLVSAIEPISQADAAARDMQTVENPDWATRPVDPAIARPSPAVSSQFEQARKLGDNGDVAKAASIYQQLIADHPRIVEPYVNLAALYASDDQLGLAQETLTRGLNAHPSYATLFANLQKVLGALAANAYQEALERDGKKIAALKLPEMDSIVYDRQQEKRLTNLQSQLELAQQQAISAQAAVNQTADTNSKLTELESNLLSAQQTINDLQTRLTKQSSIAQELLSKDQQREADLIDAQKRAEDALAARQKAEGEQAALVLAAKEQAARDFATEEQAARDLAAQQQAARDLATQEQAARDLATQEQAARDLATQEQAARDLATQEQAARDLAARDVKTRQTESATQLVKSWASAWSRQAVGDYVTQYAQNYSPPGKGLSHAEWLAQRQNRLTNKKFIQVSVSEFSVQASERGFDVSFSQHYKSNTMDDRIRKRLNFAVTGADWSNAKIIGETVLGR